MKGENDFYFPQSQPVKSQLRNVNRVKPGSPGDLTFFLGNSRRSRKISNAGSCCNRDRFVYYPAMTPIRISEIVQISVGTFFPLRRRKQKTDKLNNHKNQRKYSVQLIRGKVEKFKI